MGEWPKILSLTSRKILEFTYTAVFLIKLPIAWSSCYRAFS